MIYPSILDRRYQEFSPLMAELAKRARETISLFCERKNFAFISRLKTIESVAEKIETGRFKSWSELDDLFACAVIIPTLIYEDEVINFCRGAFTDIKITRRGQNKKAPDVFKFDSTRIYAKLARPTSLLTSNEVSIFDISFEIQVRSAFEHAWSVSTHALAYKSDAIDWKRLRLASQIKASVEQLDTLILAFEETSINILESPWSEIKNKQRLLTMIDELFSEEKLPEELAPKDRSRLCENLYNLLKSSGKEEQVKAVVKELKSEIYSTPLDRIPRSISLFQYFLAILVSRKLINVPVLNYTLHVTAELTTLYPILQGQSIYFNYEG